MMEPLERKAILFYDLCRLCLENAGANDMYTEQDLVRDIFLCTGVHVASKDNLPRKICFQCLEIVVKAKRLRLLATANETHLKSLFDDNEGFTIGSNQKKYQTQKQGNTVSRKSSTDSNCTVKLEIIENFDDIPKEESQSKKRKTSDCLEQTKENKKVPVRNDLSDTSVAVSKPEEIRKISLRKDLFETSAAVRNSEEKQIISVRNDSIDSSATVSLSTKTVSYTSTKQNLKVKIKRFKTDNDDCFHYLCDVCQKKFNGWKKYYLHQKTHNRRVTCPLDICGKMFATKGDLAKHVRTHTGERPFGCDMCDKRFSQRGTLKSHKLTVHGESETPEKS